MTDSPEEKKIEVEDGGMRKENRGGVKTKICIPPGGWVHVGNNLIADIYYTTQPDTATRTCRDSFNNLYYSNERRCSCYKIQNGVGYLWDEWRP